MGSAILFVSSLYNKKNIKAKKNVILQDINTSNL